MAQYATASTVIATIGARVLRRIRLWTACCGKLVVIYGINEDSYETIAEAIKNDNSFLKEEAQKQGIEPDMLQRLKTLEFENESMKRQIESGLEERKIRETVDSWIKDAKDITEKKIHLTTNILGNLSFAFTDYVKQNKKIDTQANHLAGGSKNESKYVQRVWKGI